MTGFSRLRRTYTCRRGFDVEAVRQPDGRWDVGRWLGPRLGVITRHSATRWEARPANGGRTTTRAALWTAIADLCPQDAS